jgi:hypothetical protein
MLCYGSMSPRLPRLTELTICAFVGAVFLVEVIVLFGQRNHLQQLALSYGEVERQQQEELDRAVSKVKKLRQQTADKQRLVQ